MIEKRKFQRKQTRINIEFEVSEVEFKSTRKVLDKGTLTDISEDGFEMLTGYPLQRGHVIIIKDGGRDAKPSFGHVKWIRKEDSTYKAGLSYRLL